jgi:hypothetical protein
VHRPAVAAHEQRRPIHQGPHLIERPADCPGHAPGRRRLAGRGLADDRRHNRRVRPAAQNQDLPGGPIGRQHPGHLCERRGWPSPEFVSGACVHHHDLIRRLNAQVRQPRGCALVRRLANRHLDPVAFRIERLRKGRIDRRQQVPLVQHRVPRRVPPRPRNPVRVHPPAARHIVAHSHARAGGPGQPAAARAAVQIDRHVHAFGAQPPHEAGVLAPAAPAAAMVDHQGLRDQRVGVHDGGRKRFDQVEEPGIGEPPAQRANCGSRQDDIANQARPDEQDRHGVSLRSWPRR